MTALLRNVVIANDRFLTSSGTRQCKIPAWSDTGLVAQLVFKTNRPPTRWDTLRHDKARFSRDFTGNCGGLEPAGTRWNPLGWWTRDGHEAGGAPSASASAGGVSSKPCKNRGAAAGQAGVA